MRVWDTASGKCTSSVQVGGRVDSLLLQGGFLFVGLHVAGVNPPPGLIKARAHAAPRPATGAALSCNAQWGAAELPCTACTCD